MSASPATSSTLIRGGQIVTMNSKRQVLDGADIRFRDGFIVEIGKDLKADPRDQVVDASDCFVIPGLIQTHTHLVQTLFRGMADDLELLDWLKKKIWPFESKHTEASIRASAAIGLMEMQLGGTTSILDMGTVRLHEHVFAEAERSGMRYWGGNCLMDLKNASGPLYRKTDEQLKYSEELIQEWHGKTSLIQYAVSPRFVISCTDKMLKAARALQEKHKLMFHTHASENKTEVQLVKKRTGLGNVAFLKKIGCLHERSVIAHGIHLTSAEIGMMVKHKAGLAHCPSSNLKLASGIARIALYKSKGMKIGLGSDGAPCNNSMDAFIEMRLAALLQKPLMGPTALPAREAFELATVGGAKVMNAEDKIGSLELGKRADVVVVRRDHASVATVQDPYSALVYSCLGRDVRDVWIDGKLIVRDGKHRIFDQDRVVSEARRHLLKLIE
jgi:5-methylthioadenosine/S-adenosylhomocysteine deaminase